MVTNSYAINIAICSLEFIAVTALWVWILVVHHRLGKAFSKAKPVITEVYPEDPNTDIREGIMKMVRQSNTIMPVIAAFASLAVFFSEPIVSFFTLFPLMISLGSYYFIFAGHNVNFSFAGPRLEVIKHVPAEVIMRNDKKTRKVLLKKFCNDYRVSVIGHINFVVAVLVFVSSTVITKSVSLTHTDLVFLMMHVTLLSYIVAFLAEVLIFKHPTQPSHMPTEQD